MAKRDQDVHFLASKEEVERIHEKMDELGIRSMGAYLRKMALDGYCIQTGFAGCESPGFAPANLLQQPEPVRKASERNRQHLSC